MTSYEQRERLLQQFEEDYPEGYQHAMLEAEMEYQEGMRDVIPNKILVDEYYEPKCMDWKAILEDQGIRVRIVPYIEDGKRTKIIKYKKVF